MLASPRQQFVKEPQLTVTSDVENTSTSSACKLAVRNLNFYYGSFQALYDITMDIHPNKVTAFIGPSGCGKSTFLRTMNRMNETVRNTKVDGEILLDNEDVFAMDVTNVRRRVGMVFQKSNPFPKSIFDNVAYGLHVNGIKRKSIVDEAVQRSWNMPHCGPK